MASRGPLNFRQRDVTAAVKAAKNAGENVARIEVDREGRITIYVGDGNMPAVTTANQLERRIDEEVALRSKLRRV
jgi:hypothetical protein